MPRPPRIQFPGAIYHVVTRGDGRRPVFHDERHYQRFTKGLADEVRRSVWDVFAYCWMPNHVHLLLRTPAANLAVGMQHWLSGYANWYAKRNCRTGHLFQGRYKAYLVEDDSYFWTLSRYIHLNPCRGSRALAQRPECWQHSSYTGYARRGARQEFVQYDALHAAWQGECGGKSPAAAYRRYVAEGLTGRPQNPLTSALREWVIGSEEFLQRMIALSEAQGKATDRTARRLSPWKAAEIIALVAEAHQVDPGEYVGFRSHAPGRGMAALLCRRYTRATLAELSQLFGLRHPDSSANLVRRAKVHEEESAVYRRRLRVIESRLRLETENQV